MVLRTDGRVDALGIAEQMTRAMAFRGPDGISHWSNGPVALGYCRMNVTSESLEESQPCVSLDGGLVVVLDGYLSNWDDLRSILLDRGSRLRDRSDVELVLNAYREWGEDCAVHIDGEYSLIVWDEQRQAIFCARDHHGLRPLYYHWDGSNFFAASDLAALQAALPTPAPLNHGYVAEIMANRWFTRDETVWTGIKRLPSAHSLTVRDRRLYFDEYWKLPTDIRIKYSHDEEYFQHYREVLSDCVRRASRSYRPLAYEVSGGLDSSALFCLADALFKNGQLPALEIKGYTLAGDPGTIADETSFARLVGNFVGRPIEEVAPFSPGIDWFLRQSDEDCDAPMYPNGAMSIGLERAAARDGCRALMTGHGGDQWLDGARRYYDEQMRTADWRGVLASMRDDLAALGWQKTVTSLATNAFVPHLSPQSRSALHWLRSLGRPAKEPELYWLSAALRDELSRRKTHHASGAVGDWRTAYKLDHILAPFLPMALDPMERQRAKSGLEGRSPMLSRPFIEFCSTTPERTRLRGDIKKFTHRRAMAGLMPAEICDRRTKAYFDPLFWQRQKDAASYCESVLNTPRTEELVESIGLNTMLQEFSSQDIDVDGIWELWGTFAGLALIQAQTRKAP